MLFAVKPRCFVICFVLGVWKPFLAARNACLCRRSICLFLSKFVRGLVRCPLFATDALLFATKPRCFVICFMLGIWKFRISPHSRCSQCLSMSKDYLSLSLKIRPWTARMFLPCGSVVLACLGARHSLSPFAMSWIPSPPNFPLLCNVVFRPTLSLVQIGVSIDEMLVSMCPCPPQS